MNEMDMLADQERRETEVPPCGHRSCQLPAAHDGPHVVKMVPYESDYDVIGDLGQGAEHEPSRMQEGSDNSGVRPRCGTCRPPADGSPEREVIDRFAEFLRATGPAVSLADVAAGRFRLRSPSERYRLRLLAWRVSQVRSKEAH